MISKSSFFSLDFGHKGQSGVLAQTCSILRLNHSKLLKSICLWIKTNILGPTKWTSKFGEVGMKEQLAINFGKYLFGLKIPFHWKKFFSWRLGPFFRCFEWKYRAVSENVFSMSVIYLHFSHCKFKFFLWIDRVRLKTWLAMGQIPELADWTGFVCKF